ncbi:sulfhydryl oxidase 1 isoform X2 [Bufo bufo]|uniref:sulfhydryl oxidase 1 isoform X2 n=1 Tax=Bufo bufo TaxID=8384 RepID=UPI001ABE04CC|nr:sulfhydryl oxidase 1 isoform X2 [Bufo bufo]
MMPGSVLRVPGVWLLLLAVLVPGGAHIYDEHDPLVSLEKGAHGLLLNSSSSWVAQFFASWCGHCQSFKSSWMVLAHDVKDWRPAVYLAVLDCAEESNTKMCKDFGVQGFPTVQFFNTYSKNPSDGIKLYNRDPDQMRQFIIDKLEAQKESPPPACPPLEPISAPEVEHFFENNDESYLALIFEEPEAYMAREVALDMVQYQGVSVRRVLKDESELVEKFKVSSFPTGFLLCKNGSVSKINLKEESRAHYTPFLRSLPGVRKVIINLVTWSADPVDDIVVRRAVNSSVIYMADLESSIHYSLRVEVARFTVLHGDRLRSLINYISVLKKYFPARPYLRRLLDYLYAWLNNRRAKLVPYKDFADAVNSKNQEQNAVLTPHADFIWCQGSKPEFRGFPCSVWTLYHLLTVRAAQLGTEQTNSLEVLKTMRGYIRSFFGCTGCAHHFEEMAKESMNSVRSLDEAIRWLWFSHNRVNKRLAGDATEDPDFPKIQWPPKELCADCQKMVGNNVTWDEPAVLRFLKTRFSENNLSYDYLEDEAVLLANQRKLNNVRRTRREAGDEETDAEEQSINEAIVPPVKAEEPEDTATETDAEEHSVNDEIAPPVKAKEPEDRATVSKEKTSPRHRPTIVKMKTFTAVQAEKEEEENIVDLDLVEHHIFPRRTLQDSNSRQNGYAIQPEKMLDLLDSEFDQEAVRARLLKRGVDENYLFGVMVENGDVNWKGRWVKMLGVGFSQLDISICVLLYFLTSMCLLAMYLYLSFRSRFRRRCLCPQP